MKQKKALIKRTSAPNRRAQAEETTETIEFDEPAGKWQVVYGTDELPDPKQGLSVDGPRRRIIIGLCDDPREMARRGMDAAELAIQCSEGCVACEDEEGRAWFLWQQACVLYPHVIDHFCATDAITRAFRKAVRPGEDLAEIPDAKASAHALGVWDALPSEKRQCVLNGWKPEDDRPTLSEIDAGSGCVRPSPRRYLEVISGNLISAHGRFGYHRIDTNEPITLLIEEGTRKSDVLSHLKCLLYAIERDFEALIRDEK